MMDLPWRVELVRFACNSRRALRFWPVLPESFFIEYREVVGPGELAAHHGGWFRGRGDAPGNRASDSGPTWWARQPNCRQRWLSSNSTRATGMRPRFESLHDPSVSPRPISASPGGLAVDIAHHYRTLNPRRTPWVSKKGACSSYPPPRPISSIRR